MESELIPKIQALLTVNEVLTSNHGYDELAAEVVIKIIDPENDWASYISLDDTLKLDKVRAALLAGDLAIASQFGKV